MLKKCSYDLLHGKAVGVYPALLRSAIPAGEQRGIRFYSSIQRLLASRCHCKVVVNNRAIAAGARAKNAVRLFICAPGIWWWVSVATGIPRVLRLRR